MHDVIIIGLGAMGSAAAYELASAGAKVLALEQYEVNHNRGSTHGRTRMIRQAYMEGEFYIPLLRRAFAKWHEMDALERRPVARFCGGLYCGRADDEVIVKTLRSARACDIPLELLGPGEVRKKFPAFKPAKDMVGLFEPGAGYANPAAMLSLYHRLAKEHGADQRFREKVIALDIGKTIRVTTDRGEYRAAKLLITAGAWAGEVARMAGFSQPFEVWRMVLHWFEPKGLPSMYKPGPFVPNLWQLPDGAVLYGFPWTEEEEGIKYAFHNLKTVVANPDAADREVRKNEVIHIHAAINRYVPNAAYRYLTSKVCFYTMTPDQHFVIGAVPGQENVVIAGGFSGHGFKFTPVIGEILRDLALKGGTDFDLSPFDPGRF